MKKALYPKKEEDTGPFYFYSNYCALTSHSGDVERFIFSSPQVVFSRYLIFFSFLLNLLHTEDQENL